VATFHALKITDGGTLEDVTESVVTTSGTDAVDALMSGQALVLVLDPTRIDASERDQALELLEHLRNALLSGDWPIA